MGPQVAQKSAQIRISGSKLATRTSFSLLPNCKDWRDKIDKLLQKSFGLDVHNSISSVIDKQNLDQEQSTANSLSNTPGKRKFYDVIGQSGAEDGSWKKRLKGTQST